jgi:hypothetical protein
MLLMTAATDSVENPVAGEKTANAVAMLELAIWAG